jgi:hypothetical protein
MATAHDLTAAGLGAQFSGGGIKYPFGPCRVGTVHLHLNFEKIVAELGVAIDTTAADTIALWEMPIGTQILGCLMHVVVAATTTAAAGTATLAIGDAGSAAGYLAATTIKTVGYTGMVVGDGYGAARRTIAAATDLVVVTAGTATAILTGIVDIYLPCMFIDPITAATIEPGSWV